MKYQKFLVESDIEVVRRFHQKHGFAEDKGLPITTQEDHNAILKECVEVLSDQAQKLELRGKEDLRLIRAHLMVEELSEAIEGLLTCNRVKLLDGLADLRYVVAGTAVAFGLPLDAAFEEVARSNMTKAVAKPGDIRLRDKGPNYQPPDLETICYSPQLYSTINFEFQSEDNNTVSIMCGINYLTGAGQAIFINEIPLPIAEEFKRVVASFLDKCPDSE